MEKLVGVGIYVLLTLSYFPLNRRRAKYFFRTWLDDLVPTVPMFVVPYVIYYWLIPMTVWLMWDKLEFDWYIKSLIVTQILAIGFWIVVPNGVRKTPLPGKDIWEKIINLIYKNDGGTNGFPSAHVFVSLIDGYFLMLAGYWWGMPLGILIASSTVLVKQHYVADVPAGILWAMVGVMVGKLI